MSSVVRSVGRAVSKVVSGVANVAKKVVRSPIGKAVVLAAGAYFLAPMAQSLATNFGASAGTALESAGGAAAAAADAAPSAFGALPDTFSAGGASDIAIGGQDADIIQDTGAFDGPPVQSGMIEQQMPGGVMDQMSRDPMEGAAPGADPVTAPSAGPAGPKPDIDAMSRDPLEGVAANEKKSGWRELLSATKTFIKENPRFAAAGLQVGGGLLAGTMQGVAAQNQRDYERQTRERELERMYNNWRVGGFRVGPDGKLV